MYALMVPNIFGSPPPNNNGGGSGLEPREVVGAWCSDFANECGHALPNFTGIVLAVVIVSLVGAYAAFWTYKRRQRRAQDIEATRRLMATVV
jgi:hypothetical protein